MSKKILIRVAILLFYFIQLTSLNSQIDECIYRIPNPQQISEWDQVYLNGYFFCSDESNNRIDEDFNDTLDLLKWSTYNNGICENPSKPGVFDWSYNSRSGAYCGNNIFLDENVSVVDGSARLKAVKETTTWGCNTKPHSTSMLKTRDGAIHMGRITVNVKLPEKGHFWPTIWLYQGGESGEEIDIWEQFMSQEFPGQNDVQILHNTYGSEIDPSLPFSKESVIKDDPIFFTEFHEIGIDWNPFKIDFLLDGHVFFTVPKYFNTSTLNPLIPECGEFIDPGYYFENKSFPDVSGRFFDLNITHQINGVDGNVQGNPGCWGSSMPSGSECATALSDCTTFNETSSVEDWFDPTPISETDNSQTILVDHVTWEHWNYDLISLSGMECGLNACEVSEGEFCISLLSENLNRQSWANLNIQSIESISVSNPSDFITQPVPNSNTEVCFELSESASDPVLSIVVKVNGRLCDEPGCPSFTKDITIVINLNDFEIAKDAVDLDYDSGTICWPTCADITAPANAIIVPMGDLTCIRYEEGGDCEVDLIYNSCSNAPEEDTWSFCCECPPGFDYDGRICWSQIEFPEGFQGEIVCETVTIPANDVDLNEFLEDCKPGFIENGKGDCETERCFLVLQPSSSEEYINNNGCPAGFTYNFINERCESNIYVDNHVQDESDFWIFENKFYTEPECDESKCCPEGSTYDETRELCLLDNDVFKFEFFGSCPDGFVQVPLTLPNGQLFHVCVDEDFRDIISSSLTLISFTQISIEPDCGNLDYDLTGTNEVEARQKNNWTLYPNPTSDNLQLVSFGDLPRTAFQIFNGQGVLVLSSNTAKGGKTNINVSHFVPGVYTIVVPQAKQSLRFVKVE